MSEVETAWCAVPDKAIVQVRSLGSDIQFAYRCNDRGRVFFYNGSWDTGIPVWTWATQAEAIRDFVVLATNVRPGGTQEVWARICGLVATAPDEEVITGVTVQAPKPGDVIGWHEVPDNVLVMDNRNTAVYLKLRGRGDTVRGAAGTPLHRYTNFDNCWHWAHRVVTPLLTVVAVDVPDNVTDATIAELIGGSANRTWFPIRAGDVVATTSVKNNTIIQPVSEQCIAVRREDKVLWIRCTHLGDGTEQTWKELERTWKNARIIALDAPPAATLAELTALVDSTQPT